MRSRPKSVCARALLFACVFSAQGVAARAQETWPSAGGGDPLAGTTRKLDDYGKMGYCSETARLDNFAITLQGEPGTKGYLLVYMGRDDMPAWKTGILGRAADYLVNARRLDASRVKVVFGGYREQRTTELWVVAAEDPAPEPSDTIDVKVDRTKAYLWDDKPVGVAFSYDAEEEVEEEGEEEAGAEDESAEDDDESTPAASAESAEGAAAKGPSEEEKAAEAAEAEERAAYEKYQIAVERRGVMREEEEPAVVAVEQAAAVEKVAAGKEEGAAAGQEEPAVGNVKVSLWWKVESFAEALRAEPDSRACLVYYYGLKDADRETVRELLARAVAKLGEQFGLKGDRVITVEGGYSPAPSVELWVVPRGAEPPKPTTNKRIVNGHAPAPAGLGL